MSYGLRTWGDNGAAQIDENSFTVRLVLSTLVTFTAAKGNQDFSVPGCDPNNSIAFVVPSGPVSSDQRQFETEKLEGVARAYNYTRTFDASSAKGGTMRLFVVRFR